MTTSLIEYLGEGEFINIIEHCHVALEQTASGQASFTTSECMMYLFSCHSDHIMECNYHPQKFLIILSAASSDGFSPASTLPDVRIGVCGTGKNCGDWQD